MSITVEELQEMVKKDLTIDRDDISWSAAQNPVLHEKYLRFIFEGSSILDKLQSTQSLIYRDLKEYYSGQASPDVYKKKPFNLKLLKNEIETYIFSDPEYVDIQRKVKIQTNLIKYLEGIMTAIRSRGYDIKNYIEWEKFKSS